MLDPDPDAPQLASSGLGFDDDSRSQLSIDIVAIVTAALVRAGDRV